MRTETSPKAIVRPQKPAKRKFPSKGQIIKFKNPPLVGDEPVGAEIPDKYRQWIVLTPFQFNQETKKVKVCPISTAIGMVNKKWEVPVPKSLKLFDGQHLEGCAVIYHITSVDWSSRGAYQVGQCPPKFLADIIQLDKKTYGN